MFYDSGRFLNAIAEKPVRTISGYIIKYRESLAVSSTYMAFSCDATLLNNSACSDFLSKCVRYVSLKKFCQACKYRCRIILAYFKSSRWLADVNAPLRVQCGLDEYMGRLQRRLYNIQRKKLYKENRLSPPSEENKMTISLAIR